MNLVDWQQRFEHWILTHHAREDAAHDLSHFRRVWATATRLAAGEEEVDGLVLLTACYFHDIVSLPKIIRAKPLLDDGGRENHGYFAVVVCRFSRRPVCGGQPRY